MHTIFDHRAGLNDHFTLTFNSEGDKSQYIQVKHTSETSKHVKDVKGI